MEIRNLYPGSWGSNCYLLTANGHAAVVDPSADAKSIVNELKIACATLDFILLTHGHFDHTVSVDTLRDLTGAPLCVHAYDAPMLTDAHKSCFYRCFQKELSHRPAERILEDGEELDLGGETIRVIHTPGHAPGALCFLCNDEFLITGDTLFSDCHGRCDLWGSDPDAMRDSLRELSKLPPDLPIYPGHNDSVSLKTALDSIIYL